MIDKHKGTRWPLDCFPVLQPLKTMNDNTYTGVDATPWEREMMTGTFQEPERRGMWRRVLEGIETTIAVLLAIGFAIAGLYESIGESKRTLFGMLLISVGIFWGLIHFKGLLGDDFSVFGSMLLMASLGCNLFYVVVRYGHAKTDPITQIRNGNVAAVLYYCIYAALIIAGFLALKP